MKERFYGEKYINSIDAEWCQDGHLDFAIVVKNEILLDPEFGFNVDSVIPNEYNHTDLGTYWCNDDTTWIWAIASSYNPITEKTRRKHIKHFNLFDSESATIIHNTKIWNVFKKGITPMIDKIIQKELSSK